MISYGGISVRGNTYIEQLKNVIVEDSPNYIKQRLINELIEKGVCTNNGKEEGKLNIRGMISRESKIESALEYNMEATLKIFESIELKKGYKYSIIFEYDDINIDRIMEAAINIDDVSYLDINSKDEIGINIPLYLKEDDMIYLKFFKSIDIIKDNINGLQKMYIRYPILVAININDMILDIRFDKLYHGENENFYNMCLDTIIDWLKSAGVLNLRTIELDNIVKHMLNNKSDEVEEIISSFDLSQEKGATLKAGKDKVMPFLGELKNILKKNSEIFNKNDDTIECLNIIHTYINNTIRFADYKYRILNIIKKSRLNENIDNINEDIEVKVIFNYRGGSKDLVNFYSPEINNMERINYVVKYIRSIEKCIK
jgi:hypothetical protein